MTTPAEPQPYLRFGDFELDLHTRELRSNGKTLNLQEQPFQVLAILLERPGELVTRDELMKRLWPSDTFVDFDQSLNKAVNRLREVLGDSAEKPFLIGTIPRRGYRFLAPVNTVDSHPLPREAPKALPSVLHVVPAPEIRRKWFLLGLGRIVVTAVAVAATAGAGLLAGRVYWQSAPPSFHRITFRRQYISAARFGGDSKTIVYSAALDRSKPQVFSESSENPESRELGMGIAHVLSISKTGQMAILREPLIWGAPAFYKGILAQTSLSGGGTREIRQDVVAADWDPEGKQLAEGVGKRSLPCRISGGENPV